MQDRVSASPGRVLITPESGEAYYATIERADNPTVEGTPINKNTLLKDATASLYGLSNAAVPDDVLVAIRSLLQNVQNLINAKRLLIGSYVGTGTYGANNPTIINFGFTPTLWGVFACKQSINDNSDPLTYTLNNIASYTHLPSRLTLENYMNYGGSASKGGGAVYAKKIANGVSFYADANMYQPQVQLNFLGATYYYFAISM